jgi:flagellar biosynthesis protein FlhF
MRIKSYFAESVQEAIEKARIELGPDAMLMNSKKTDFELRALGAVEVVFGVPGQIEITKPRLQVRSAAGADNGLAHSTAASADPAPGAAGDVAQELAELRRQIETVTRSMNRQQRVGGATDERPSRALENIRSRLIAADISDDLANQIAEAAESQSLEWKQSSARGVRDFEMTSSETLELALSAELDRRFQVAPELGLAGAKQKIVMFVGPAGAGKTTSLIKLGLRYGLQARLPLHILSLDTLKVGGWEQLASYARIAGLGFDAVHNLTALDQLLGQHADKNLILIDTPGFCPADADDLSDLAGWVKRSATLDIQLVVPATLRPSVIQRTIERFSALRPSKLLLTHADEVESPGTLLDISMRSGLALSYVSNGQTIPEDIVQASKADLLACLAERPGRAKMQAAA